MSACVGKHCQTESVSSITSPSPIPLAVDAAGDDGSDEHVQEYKDEIVDVCGNDEEEDEDELEEPPVCLSSIPIFKQMAADEEEDDAVPMAFPLRLQLRLSGSGSFKIDVLISICGDRLTLYLTRFGYLPQRLRS